MRPSIPPTVARFAGFGLIEILVSMVIGLVTFLVIAQVFAGFESSKRTTMFGVDAQVGGLLALRILEKEIRQGGYGLTGNGAMMCPVINQYFGGATTPLSAMPVRINDAGGTTPDSIDTFYGGSAFGAAPLNIAAAVALQTDVQTVVAGLAACDFVLYASPNGSKDCSLLQVTAATANTKIFTTDPGQSNYNPQAVDFPIGYDSNDVVINMGNFTNMRLQVAQTAGAEEYFLRQTNLNPGASSCAGGAAPTPTADLVGNVVDIQAQYGVAGVGSQRVECWTDAVTAPVLPGTYCDGKNWADPDAALKNRIKAVRVAVAVRSALPEQPAVPGGACDTTTAAPVGWAGGPTMSGVTAVANWQCYRYKVYQTITPLVNVIWANS